MASIKTEETSDVEGWYDDNICSLTQQLKEIEIKNEVDLKCLINKATWLKYIESPFLWHTQEKRTMSIERVIERHQLKEIEINVDILDFSLRRYTLLFGLVLEYTLTERKEKVDETVDKITKLLVKENAEKDPNYATYKLILNYLLAATNANLLALSGQEERSKQIAQSLLPVCEMSNSDRVRLWAIKSYFIRISGYENGPKVAVGLLREALQLEPDNHECMFLLAKSLRQQRRDVPFSDENPKDELLILERVVELNGNIEYLHYLAQSYMECANQAHRKHRNHGKYFGSQLHKTVQAMQTESLKYYKKALAAAPNNPANLRRVGYGIMNLPPKLADYDLALEYLLKSLELCENNSTIHMIGTFYSRFLKDYKKALIYYEKSANMGSVVGLCDMIRVKLLEDQDYDPSKDFEKGLQWKLKSHHRISLLSQQAGYFLFIKRDILKSLDVMKKIIAEDKDLYLTKFKSNFLRMYKNINLYYYSVNELLLYREENKKIEDDNLYELMSVINAITNIHPALAEVKVDPLLVPDLLETSEEIRRKEDQKRKPHQNYNTRGNMSGGHRGGQRRCGYHDHIDVRPIADNQKLQGNVYSEEWIQKEQDKAEKKIEEDRKKEERRNHRFSGSYRGQDQCYRKKNKNREREDEDNDWRRK